MFSYREHRLQIHSRKSLGIETFIQLLLNRMLIMNNFIKLPLILTAVLSFPISGSAAPSCEATFVGLNANGDKFAQFTAHDNNHLGNVGINEMKNVSINFDISGTNNKYAIFTAIKVDQSQKSIITAEVSDTSGNTSNCIDFITVHGDSVKKKYPKILKKAGDQVIVHVQNTDSGITELKVKVNNNLHTVALTNGQYQTLDISSDLQNGNDNKITFKGVGGANTVAYIIIYGS